MSNSDLRILYCFCLLQYLWPRYIWSTLNMVCCDVCSRLYFSVVHYYVRTVNNRNENTKKKKKKEKRLTRKMSDGIGVKFRTLMREMAEGRCPLRAPTKNNRDDAKIAPFRAPKVEQATKSGIIQDITPSSLLPKVWKRNNRCERKIKLFTIFYTQIKYSVIRK